MSFVNFHLKNARLTANPLTLDAVWMNFSVKKTHIFKFYSKKTTL